MSLTYLQFLDKVPGLTKRQLDHWSRKGWLLSQQGTAPAKGGRARLWLESEVAIAALMLRLVRAGWHAEPASQVARHVVNGLSSAGGVKIGPGLTLRIDAVS